MKDIGVFAQMWLWQACWLETGTGYAMMSMPSGGGDLLCSCTAKRAIPAGDLTLAESTSSQVTEADLLGILDWLDMVVADSDMAEQEVEEVRQFIEIELDALRTQTTGIDLETEYS